MELLKTIPPERPVLIAGPTAAGKSAIALELAAQQGGVIVNADALQVYSNWRILTARPSEAEEAVAEHRLYGHVAADATYSAGHWLREVAPILKEDVRPIIVGGTGLNFAALTEGLAEVPAISPETRDLSQRKLDDQGLAALLAELDAETAARIDRNNPMRVQRAWEVLHQTGRGLAAWQDETPTPLLPLSNATPLLLNADRNWLAARIERRFDAMMADGALEEAARNLDSWQPDLPSSRAIGAADLVAHLRGEVSLQEARDSAVIATRQYAKRQRTWFRSRMKSWRMIELS